MARKRTKVRRSRKQKQHEISFRIPRGALGIVDAEFDVRRDGELIGTLLVSRGAIEWVPTGATTYQYLLPWQRFSTLMKRVGRKRRKPGV
jgi:hypothetical protein